MGQDMLLVGLGLTLVAAIVVFLVFNQKKKVALDARKKIKFKLVEREEVTHNVRRFRFVPPEEGQELGLPIGKHVFLSTMQDGKLVSRPYSPISPGDAKFMDVVVKVYYANEHPKFPAGGQMSQFMDTLKVGDYLDVRGPIGKYEYAAPGVLTVKKTGGVVETKQVQHLGMIAGGTGVTPLLSIARAILADPSDHTHVSLLFANNTEDDIILRPELDRLAEQHSNFKVWYVLVDPPASWDYSKGFVSQEMIKEQLPTPGQGTTYLLCGPPPMIKFACMPAFEKMGVPEGDILVW